MQKQVKEEKTAEIEKKRLWVEIPLLEEIRFKFPETTRMGYTRLNDWALRKLLEA